MFKCPEKLRWREEVLSNKWPHITQEISLRKIFTVKNITE
jgi:hypothetical protein